MNKIATPHFDFESKKAYMKPAMQTVVLTQRTAILAGSVDAYGMDKSLIEDEEVTEGWARFFDEGDDFDWSE